MESMASTPQRYPASLAPQLRSSSDAEAQTLRRALLYGSRILVVMAGYPGEPVRRDYFARARELGVELVLVESARHMAAAEELISAREVESAIAVDLGSDAPSRRRLLEVVRRNGPFHGVWTFVEFGLPLTAWLARELGLPGNPVDVVELGRDKERMRQRARDVGLSTPRFCRIRNEADLIVAQAKVGFPAIFKPVAGLTSIEVHLVRDSAELLAKYRAVTERMRRADHGNPEMLAAIREQGCEFILEEFLEGREFDVDFVLSDGECVYAAVTDNIGHPTWPFVLANANMPAELSHADSRQLIETAVDSTFRLGYREGVFHVELKWKNDASPALLEINARVGGASQYQLNRAVWGVDLIEEQLLSCVGIPNRPCVASAPLRSFATQYLLAPRTGIVVEGDYLREVKASLPTDAVLVCEPWATVGSLVQGPERGPPDWIGEITVAGTNLEEARSALAHALSQVDYSFIRSA